MELTLGKRIKHKTKHHGCIPNVDKRCLTLDFRDARSMVAVIMMSVCVCVSCVSGTKRGIQ